MDKLINPSSGNRFGACPLRSAPKSLPALSTANPNRIGPGFTEYNLHPNDAGYRAIAESIDLGLFRQG
jgi:hypothetical protein